MDRKKIILSLKQLGFFEYSHFSSDIPNSIGKCPEPPTLLPITNTKNSTTFLGHDTHWDTEIELYTFSVHMYCECVQN